MKILTSLVTQTDRSKLLIFLMLEVVSGERMFCPHLGPVIDQVQVMFNVKYCGHRYPLVFMLVEYLKFPVAS